MYTFQFPDGSWLKANECREHPSDSQTFDIKKVYWYRHYLTASQAHTKMTMKCSVVNAIQIATELQDKVEKLEVAHEAAMTLADANHQYSPDGPREYVNATHTTVDRDGD